MVHFTIVTAEMHVIATVFFHVECKVFIILRLVVTRWFQFNSVKSLLDNSRICHLVDWTTRRLCLPELSEMSIQLFFPKFIEIVYVIVH